MTHHQLFVKGNGERIYYPNTRLITLPVTNLTRTATKGDKVLFLLDIGISGTAAKEALTVYSQTLLQLLRRHTCDKCLQ
jgi:hypothetical protein